MTAEQAHVLWYCLMDVSLHTVETSNAGKLDGTYPFTLPPMLVTENGYQCSERHISLRLLYKLCIAPLPYQVNFAYTDLQMYPVQ
jgi:hypothetical protein